MNEKHGVTLFNETTRQSAPASASRIGLSTLLGLLGLPVRRLGWLLAGMAEDRVCGTSIALLFGPHMPCCLPQR